MTPAPLLDSQLCIDALVAHAGNTAAAAESLGVQTHTLVASIAQDPQAEEILNRQLRMLATLHTFDTFRAAKLLVDGAMVDMEPRDLARFFADMSRQIAESTDTKTSTTNINIAEHVVRSLSPEAREALLALQRAGGANALDADPTPTTPAGSADGPLGALPPRAARVDAAGYVPDVNPRDVDDDE